MPEQDLEQLGGARDACLYTVEHTWHPLRIEAVGNFEGGELSVIDDHGHQFAKLRVTLGGEAESRKRTAVDDAFLEARARVLGVLLH